MFHVEHSKTCEEIKAQSPLRMTYEMERQIEGNIVDIHHRDIFPGVVSVENGRIVSIVRTAKRYDDYILPGFIDAHVHIESSMLTPLNFSRLVVSKGTVAIVNDPHEIANVLGKEGVDFMLNESREALIKIFFTIPSCVPATEYDFPGRRLLSDEVEELAKSGRFVGLSEMMNVPGVLQHQLEPMRKISIACRYGLPVDGHAPGLMGADLRKYVQTGIFTDHECVTIDEALEKINAGMKILIREGSAAKNYEALKSLIASHPEAVMFCTDDAHPGDIVHIGHIDKMVRRAVSDGFDLFDVLKIACIHPVLHYHLPVGLLRVDDSADFIVVRDLKSFEVCSVYISGEEKYRSDMVFQPKKEFLASYPNQFAVNSIAESQLQQAVSSENLCIGVKNGEIVTTKEVFSAKPAPNFQSDTEKDVLKVVYLNRYRNEKPQIAFIRGIGLKKGAFATSISHDSHNIIAVGCTDKELALAINAIVAEKGGLSVVDQEAVSLLPLPIAGIMTDHNAIEVARRWDELTEELHRLGCLLDSPFMTLSFMALIVIPELKIGEKGLFEYSSFRFLSE